MCRGAESPRGMPRVARRKVDVAAFYVSCPIPLTSCDLAAKRAAMRGGASGLN
jgi:hypothetical protein